ncbi:MAG: aminoglycoside phosphotransferase family protein [Chloroflexota bacterium]|nr:aminoglycoside phosphotransferase family protein [Chloroflexota bacterium]
MSDRLSPTTEPAASEPDLLQAVSMFFPAVATIEALPGRDAIVRVRADSRWWKVRRWPEGIPRLRLELIHRVLAQVAASDPALAPVVARLANDETILFHQGRLYDAQSWLPGSPAGGGPEARLQSGRWVAMPAVVPDPVFHEVLRTVAGVHAATAPLVERDDTADRPPLADLIAAVTDAWTAQRGMLRPIATQTPAVRRWLAMGERALPAAETAIGASALGTNEQAINHFGLWPAHALIADESDPGGAAGLIGWEHCNAGSPLIDIVQAVSRFRGWTAAAAETAIAAYSEVQPLRPEDRRLLPAVAALDLVATSGQMLIFAYGGRSGGERPPAILREAARSLLDSLDVATNALIAMDRPKRPAYDRGRRPGGPRRTTPKRKPRGPKKRR